MCKGKQQMKFWKLASTASILVLSTSTNAALITQSFTSTFGGTADAITNKYLGHSYQAVAIDNAYTFTAFTGFDASLGDLVSVNLAVNVNPDTNRLISASDNSGNGTSYGTASLNAAYFLNINVGAGNYDHTILSRSIGNSLNCVNPYSACLTTSTDSFPSVNGTINLLAWYNPEDFMIANIGFQSHQRTSAYIENCYWDCFARSTLSSDTTLTISYVYEDQVSTVPVPAAVWLFGSGLIGLVGFARRKKA